MIIDPWGRVLAELRGGEEETAGDEGPAFATAEIDLDLVAKVRREVPLRRRT
jgi:predicted amidohydrolase